MSTNSQSIHIIGVAGTGVGALAGLLLAAGHRVRGSDENVYEPMKSKLAEWGVPVFSGYDAAHLTPAPDLVIVGNVIRRANVEASAARDRQLPTMSMPQALAHFGIGQRHSIVVTGTHGKTTTSALCAHLLMANGRDPGFLVAGAMRGYRDSFHLGTGSAFVVEGDEYDTAYFDKGPKFLHYRAQTLILTSLEFDHADIYADITAVEQAFAKLIDSLPAGANVLVWHGASRARALLAARSESLRVMTYDSVAAIDATSDAAPSWQAGELVQDGDGAKFVVSGPGFGPAAMQVPLWGVHNVHNTLAALAVAHLQGLDEAQIRQALASFAGVEKRLIVRGACHGALVVEDFAHHPTAVRVTLEAARARWPNRRVWAAFEPRSATSRRNVFAAEYVAAFLHADGIVLSGHPRLAEVPEAQRFNSAGLVQALRDAGRTAIDVPTPHDVGVYLAANVTAGDVILLLSNGDFGGLVTQLTQAAVP